MSVSKNILLIFIVLTLQGCINRTITDYENCVSEELTFEFKDKIGIYIIDDSEGKNKYSSMNFPKGEYYLCVKEGMRCLNFSGEYYEGWNIIHVKSKTIQLTGKYKTNKPNGILSAFAPDTEALQVVIDGNKAWISVYELEDVANFKKSSDKSIQELNKNRKLATDWNDWMTIFECPNPNVLKKKSERIWFD